MIVNKYKGNGGGGGTGSTITVDTALSSSSTNPVENRVITNALADYASEEYVDEALSGLTEDIPTAQDGSDVKQYVYCATGTTSDDKKKYLLTDISFQNNVVSNSNTPRFTILNRYWGGIKDDITSIIPQRTGDITRAGLKTLRDSAIINSAEEALAGFDEEITLTLGDVSEVDYVTGRINSQSNQTRYLYETDNERYEVLPLSGFATSDYITSFVIDNTTLYPYNFFDLPMGGEKLQLETYKGNFGRLSLTYIGGQDIYLIIDKELLTLSVTDSLTITRTKSIAEAISGSTPDDSLEVLDQVVSQAILDLNEKKVESEDIKHIVKLTQAEYDQLATKDPETFYIIITNNN